MIERNALACGLEIYGQPRFWDDYGGLPPEHVTRFDKAAQKVHDCLARRRGHHVPWGRGLRFTSFGEVGRDNVYEITWQMRGAPGRALMHFLGDEASIDAVAWRRVGVKSAIYNDP